MLLRPKQVTNLTDVPIAKVFAGSRHSAALLADGSIRTWGRNLHGQLGIGIRSDAESSPTCVQQLEPVKRFTHLALGGSHSLFLDEHGSVWSAGRNDWGQLGLGTSLSSLSTSYQRPQDLSQADNPEHLMPMPVVMVKTELDHRVCQPVKQHCSANYVFAHFPCPHTVSKRVAFQSTRRNDCYYSIGSPGKMAICVLCSAASCGSQ